MFRTVRPSFPSFLRGRKKSLRALGLTGAVALLAGAAYAAPPKVILISLDGGTLRLVNQYLSSGVDATTGLNLLRSKGVMALQNQTISPSLTAAGHIAIATGSTAAATDVVNNTYALVASPFLSTISGFGGPIGGYLYDLPTLTPSESPNPTAEPIWVALRKAGKKVVTATFPGGDGVDVRVPGRNANTPGGNPIIQTGLSKRTVDYTVPFGAFAGPSSFGLTLNAAKFGGAPSSTISQLSAAGIAYVGAPLQTTDNADSFTVSGVKYNIKAVALASTTAGQYDTLVFFDVAQGIKKPNNPPTVGTAVVKIGGPSQPFYLEGSVNRVGLGYFVSTLTPDLSTIHVARYSGYTIPTVPTNPNVANAVNDIYNNVGFWKPSPDFRIPERIAGGFDTFPDAELELIYEDLVSTWTDYQLAVALRAIDQNQDADLVMTYFEQPDGSEHQFLLVDSRQPTNPLNPNSIGAGQDADKIARYQKYLKFTYQKVNQAVQAIINKVGVDANGKPNSDIIVVSDHGFEEFHTAVNMTQILKNAGFDNNKVRAVTSGPATNIYINLQGREPNGTVSKADYLTLQTQIVNALKAVQETNPLYTQLPAGQNVPVFDKIYTRPAALADANFGLETGDFIAQDSGDVVAIMAVGYNFDGIQGNGIARRGDGAAVTPILSLPNFYGAHGYDPLLPNLSAIFFAAGPDIGHTTLSLVHNIDIAPTIANLLGVTPASTVQGTAIGLGNEPLALIKAASRRTHGTVGAFDIALPLSGATGVEGRRAGTGGSYTLVFTFNNNVDGSALPTAAVTTGTGSVNSVTVVGNDVIVTLTGVSDVQTLGVTLSNVKDVFANTLATTALGLRILVGDVNGDGKVDAADLAAVKAGASVNSVNANNFRDDVNANGAINSSDVAITQADQGHTVP